MYVYLYRGTVTVIKGGVLYPNHTTSQPAAIIVYR